MGWLRQRLRHAFFVVFRRAAYRGKDIRGNRYYELMTRGRVERFVVYAKLCDASNVTPDWHGWLHFMTDLYPENELFDHWSWQKMPLPNLTGTVFAYHSKENVRLKMEKRETLGGYVPWQPKSCEPQESQIKEPV